MTEVLALVISYNRPDNMPTLRNLDRHGFTGPVRILVADDDPKLDQYLELHGDKVIEFNKEAAEEFFDPGDNFQSRNASVYPRAVAHKVAADLGYRWFVQLDDDYTGFHYRFKNDRTYDKRNIGSLDLVIDAMVEFAEETGVLVAMSQGGEWMGGANCQLGVAIRSKRKAMNWFVCDTENPVDFPGKLNEDVNMYTEGQRRGDVTALTLSHTSLEQADTQGSDGGITDMYLSVGTYVKSMYSVMRCPSAVVCTPMPGGVTPRLHHRVTYNRCAPKIISETHRRAK